MPRLLFIVSSGDPATFRSLTSVLADDPDAEVIYDRRAPDFERDQRVSWGVENIRPLADRRRRPEADTEIRTRGWTCVRVQPEPSPFLPLRRRALED